MPRRLLGVFLLLLVSVSLVRAQGDAVLLKVGPMTVSRSEFEYHFSRSPEPDKDAFLQTFVRYKWKVLQAREMGMDTLPDFQIQHGLYRDVWRLEEQFGKKRAASKRKEWIKLMHVTCPLEQQSSKQEERQAKHHLDSLYATLDVASGLDIIGKELPWIETRYLLNEWQDQVSHLERNQVSRPFYSPLGVHLISWKEKRVASLDWEQNEQTFDEKFQQTLVEEALLVAAWEAGRPNVITFTEKELENRFKRHRVEYGAGTPHFRGAVIHCQNKKEAKAIRKYLKKYPEALWQEAISRVPAEVSSGCLIEMDFFPIGENVYVDKLVFKCGGFEPLVDYPYTFVLGKKLKKGPKSYRDVHHLVEKDCKKEREEVEMRALETKYGVEINEEVLKTVNRYGNK